MSITSFIESVKQRQLKIGVVGDAMVDVYQYGKVSRISPEFPVPILSSTSYKLEYYPGGAANCAHQFQHLNSDVTLFSFMDTEAIEQLHPVIKFNTDSCIHLPNDAKIPRKIRFYDGDFPLLRYDVESPTGDISQARKNLYKLFTAKLPELDVVILSNYNKGLFEPSFASWIIQQCLHYKIPTIVDPKSGTYKWQGVTVFKPNAAEARQMTEQTNWKNQCRDIQRETGCHNIIITQQGDGVVGMDNGELFEYRPKNISREISSVIGAGDCFSAVLALAVGHKQSITNAATYAFEAGVQYVKARHNRPITLYELHRRIDPLHAKIVSIEDLVYLREGVYKDLKWTWTNGAFDIVHGGHLATLQHAKSQGDKLVVGINSDDSVKRLKGELRPIQPLEERMQVIAALECVDFVVSFEEDTPYNVIKSLKPDVMVKGAHYRNEIVAGADIVGEVVFTDIVPGNSTTNIVEKIRSSDK